MTSPEAEKLRHCVTCETHATVRLAVKVRLHRAVRLLGADVLRRHVDVVPCGGGRGVGQDG